MSIARTVTSCLALMTLGTSAQALCVAPKAVGGVWRANDGGSYVMRELGPVVWWLGRSGDGGKSFTNVFRGVINGNTIDGEWTDLMSSAHENADQGHGTLKLRIIGAVGSGVDGLEKIGGTGAGFAASKWFQPCPDTN